MDCFLPGGSLEAPLQSFLIGPIDREVEITFVVAGEKKEIRRSRFCLIQNFAPAACRPQLLTMDKAPRFIACGHRN